MVLRSTEQAMELMVLFGAEKYCFPTCKLMSALQTLLTCRFLEALLLSSILRAVHMEHYGQEISLNTLAQAHFYPRSKRLPF